MCRHRGNRQRDQDTKYINKICRPSKHCMTGHVCCNTYLLELSCQTGEPESGICPRPAAERAVTELPAVRWGPLAHPRRTCPCCNNSVKCGGNKQPYLLRCVLMSLWLGAIAAARAVVGHKRSRWASSSTGRLCIPRAAHRLLPRANQTSCKCLPSSTPKLWLLRRN
jgi:hypothetical protein